MPKLLSAIILSLSFLVIHPLDAGPVSIVGQTPDKTISINKISHTELDELLAKYVDENGDVNYSNWQKNDFETLEKYLESLSKADPEKKANDAAKLSFWINAYNALTIYGILEKYPTTSIKNHTAKIFGYNIWKDLKLQVADRVYSLDDIEHDILRHMDEPRIHFAIVCASESCPRLRNDAYLADELEEQLVDNSEHFFAQEGNFQIDEDAGRIYLSSILKWFGEDFGDSKSEILETIEPYLLKDDAETLNKKEKWKVSYLPYSWKLNDQQ